jgi:chromosome partitioning protein
MIPEAYMGGEKSAHIIVVGNEKGGSGKSTTCMHIAMALLGSGQRVATIDLDSRQRTFTHYVENRRAWKARTGTDLPLPTHSCVGRAECAQSEDNEVAEFGAFNSAISAVEHTHDFVVIDTPGIDSYLMQVAHALADTLVTPLNDSFVDFDVLAKIEPTNFAITGFSHYAEMVREARRQRRLLDGREMDWVVIRNRVTSTNSRNRRQIGESLAQLAGQLGFRIADGIPERVVYREFFTRGLTALDDLKEATLGARPTLSHIAARQEVRALVENLRLPLDARREPNPDASTQWPGVSAAPQLDVVIAKRH